MQPAPIELALLLILRVQFELLRLVLLHQLGDRLLLHHQVTQVHFGSSVGNNPAMRENGTPHLHAGRTTAAMVGSLPGLTSATRFPHALETKRGSRSENLTSSAHWSTTSRPRITL